MSWVSVWWLPTKYISPEFWNRVYAYLRWVPRPAEYFCVSAAVGRVQTSGIYLTHAYITASHNGVCGVYYIAYLQHIRTYYVYSPSVCSLTTDVVVSWVPRPAPPVLSGRKGFFFTNYTYYMIRGCNTLSYLHILATIKVVQVRQTQDGLQVPLNISRIKTAGYPIFVNSRYIQP